MDTTKFQTKNVLLAFFIGLIAGIAPFVFMKLLPVLLNPGLHLTPPNYYAIAITGILIGAITAIIFGTTDDKRAPHDVFLYALGIPAVLIATVSNLSTEFGAMKEVSTAKENLSSSILLSPSIEKVTITPVPVPIDEKGKNSGWLENTAWAQETSPGQLMAQANDANRYLLTIGTYHTKDEAIVAYRDKKKSRLAIEQYVPKSLELIELNKNEYVLIYNKYSTQKDATKAYQLLRVNDPNVPTRILEK